jgi:ATP-dependent Clp protease ATP-binding subunit ClpC
VSERLFSVPEFNLEEVDMPQSVTIDLPLVISPRGGLTLVRPLGFPDIALASRNEATAVRAVRRRVAKRCSDLIGSQLVSFMVRGKPEKRTVNVAIAPEKKSLAWRDPIHVKFDVFQWQQGETMMIAYVPPLDLTVVATPQTDLEKLVQEQVRSSIRRRGIWSLVGLARLDRTDGTSLVNQRIEIKPPTPAEHARTQEEKPKTKTPTLSSVATRLNRKSLRPAYYRDEQVEQLARLLAAEPSRSVLLVGPSGVGKTAIFHEWVRRRGEFGSDRAMASVTCWSTDGSRLISGQSGFGMWQQQCLQMSDEARRFRSVVHLGNLVELSESGRLRGSGGCGALLAPRLANGSLKAVIECTPEQLTRIERVEPRLVQSLTTLRVEEPTPEQTRSILLEAATSWRPRDISAELKRKKRKKRKKRTGGSRGPRSLPVVEPEALQVLDRLHRRFRTDAAAPGRPLRFFHTVMSELEPDQTLDAQQVIETFGRQTGLPSFLIDDSVRPDLDSIQRQLTSQVIGQDAVIETLVDMIATLAADLSRGDRPLASLMLIGPTGVGKTETAKALARLIYSDVSRLVRIDMSELSTPSAVGRLIGDGMHPEGLLTSAVRAEPFSLVLLDEFEKAHPTVFDLLLQVLGEGRLTDGRGRLADFRNAIVLMTSNLGVDTFRPVPLGLAETQQKQRYQNHFQRQVRDFLRPEMFNRIDRILTYDPLEESTVRQIAQLRLDELKRRDGWQSHGNQFDVDEAAMASLTHFGYEPQYGARPLTREIERSVVVPLSEAICESGRLKKLDAKITATDSLPTSRVLVGVTSDPLREKRFDASVVELIEEMTTLRRRGQAFDRCDAVRRIRNQYTMVNRKLKTLLRAAKNDEQREKIRYGPLGIDRMQTRERIMLVRLLCDDINDVEASLCASYYRGQTIDRQVASAQVEAVRDRLWNMLCEIHGEAASENQRMTLVLSGPNLDPAKLLLDAYRQLATTRGWNLQVHALLRRAHDNASDRVIDCHGWCDEPAFRVSTDRDQVEVVLDPWIQTEHRRPSLAAYRLVRYDALSSLPSGTLGVMLTFRGPSAALMMGSEAGVHTFNRLNQPKSTGCSVLIDKHAGMPIQYVAPDWLPRREFQVTGHPRRWYDVDSDLVHDMTDNNSCSVKMDRQGKWLETLIEQETERRIWSELDEA